MCGINFCDWLSWQSYPGLAHSSITTIAGVVTAVVEITADHVLIFFYSCTPCRSLMCTSASDSLHAVSQAELVVEADAADTTADTGVSRKIVGAVPSCDCAVRRVESSIFGRRHMKRCRTLGQVNS